MSKPVFVRAVIVRSLPAIERVDQAIDYAEAVWARLTARGYGHKNEVKPRQSIDYYGLLEGPIKAGFDRFWRAFARPGDDKQGAAQRWGQLAETGALEPQLIERICQAAAAEANLPRAAEEVRVMARRWLFERRWEGYKAGQEKDPGAGIEAKMRKLSGDLAHLKGMRESMPYDGLEAHIAELEKQLGELRRNP